MLTTAEEDLSFAASVIKNGGLCAFPTETVYGLGGNALNPGAAHDIYAAKGRPSDNPLIIHIANAADAEKYCYPTEEFYRLAEIFLPGPLTMILEKRDIIPPEVTAGLDSVAVRIPSNPVARRLIELSGVPIAAPSANLSGKPSPTTAKHVFDDMNGRIECIIDGGECDIGLESTIIKLTGDGAVLLRPGGVTYEQLCGALGADKVIIGDSVTGKFEGKPIAPGMKYRHYAPDAPVFLIDGGDAEVCAYIEQKYAESGEKRVGILCYDEDIALRTLDGAETMGKKSDSRAQAHLLFDRLRAFHGVDVIYSRLPSKDGIGLAVYNRLIKAAGFHIIKV